MIAPTINIANRPHRVRVQLPTAPVWDADTGMTHAWIDAQPPTLLMAIEPTSAQDLERVPSGTVVSSATHIISGPYHPQLTTQCRLLVENGRAPQRVFSILGVESPEFRRIDVRLYCTEIVE